VLSLYQFGPMHISECNHIVTGNGYKAMDGCEAVSVSVKAEDRPMHEGFYLSRKLAEIGDFDSCQKHIGAWEIKSGINVYCYYHSSF